MDTIIETLRLDLVEEDAWDIFLDSERSNSLLEPLVMLDYTAAEDVELLDGISATAVARGFLRLSAFLKSVVSQIWRHVKYTALGLATMLYVYQVVGEDDHCVWLGLRGPPDSTTVVVEDPESRSGPGDVHDEHTLQADVKSPSGVNSSMMSTTTTASSVFVGSTFSRAQALLLLIVQCVHDGHPVTFLPAVDLFFTLCQYPEASSHFFSPNLFLARRIVKTWQGGVSQDLEVAGDMTAECSATGLKNSSETQACEKSHGAAKSSLTDMEMASPVHVEELLSIVQTFLINVSLRFLHSDIGRDFVTTITGACVQLVLRTPVDTLRHTASSVLWAYFSHLEKIRSEAEKTLSLSGFSPISEASAGGSVQAGYQDGFFIPFARGEWAGDAVLFGCATCLRPVTFAFALRRLGGGVSAPTNASAARSLLMSQKAAFGFVCGLVERVPILLDKGRLQMTRVYVEEVLLLICDMPNALSNVLMWALYRSKKASRKEAVSHAMSGTGNPKKSHKKAKALRSSSHHGDRPEGGFSDEENSVVESDVDEGKVNEDDLMRAKNNSSQSQPVCNDTGDGSQRVVKHGNDTGTFEEEDVTEDVEESGRDPLLAFLCRACLLVPDRRDPRDVLTSRIVDVLVKAQEVEKRERLLIRKGFPSLLSRFMRFLVFLMQSHRPSLRTVAVDVSAGVLDRMFFSSYQQYLGSSGRPGVMGKKLSSQLLTSCLLWDCEKVTVTERSDEGVCCCLEDFEMYLELLLHLIQRCRDSQPWTRARAVENVALLMHRVAAAVGPPINLELLLAVYTRANGDAACESLKNSTCEYRSLMVWYPLAAGILVLFDKEGGLNKLSDLATTSHGTTTNNKLPPLVDIYGIMVSRCRDDKQVVRKAALSLLKPMALLLTRWTVAKKDGCLSSHLERMGIVENSLFDALCHDVSLQVRAKAIATLHELSGVLPPNTHAISRLWLQCVVPAAGDVEKLVSEKALEYISDAVVEGLARLTPQQWINGCEAIGEPLGAEVEVDGVPRICGLLVMASEEDSEHIQRSLALLHRHSGGLSRECVRSIMDIFKAIKDQDPFERKCWSVLAFFRVVEEVIRLESRLAKTVTAWEMQAQELCVNTWRRLWNCLQKREAQETTERLAGVRTTLPLSYAKLLSVAQCLLKMVFALTTRKQTSDKISDDMKSFLAELEHNIENLKFPLSLITPALECVSSLRPKVARSGMASSLWAKTISESIQVTVTEYYNRCVNLSPENLPCEVSSEKLARSLLTLGDLLYMFEVSIPGPVLTRIHALASGCLRSRASEFHLNGGADNSENLNSTQPYEVPEVVRSQAFLCLGKLCLAREQATKKLIDLMATHLGEKHPESLRCNILAIFADLCVRYTSLTDRYMPQMTACLASGFPRIRKQALCLVGNLVAQDYIKPKGLTVFRLLACLGDAVLRVRRLAEAVVLHVLMPRQTNFIQNHFVEMICFICSWLGHPIFRASALGGSASAVRKGSPFCAVNLPRKRQMIYSFFLAHMTDRDRHELSRRLVHDFLGAFVDDDAQADVVHVQTQQQSSTVKTPSHRGRQLDLPRTAEEPAGAALRDALRLLGCKQMKITFEGSRNNTVGSCGNRIGSASGGLEEDEEVDEDAAGGVGGKGGGRKPLAPGACTGEGQERNAAYELNLLKRNLAYQVLPTLLSLKRVMEDARSIFLRDILQCLAALLYDYKHELSDILFHDPILARQLDFDFKRGVLNNPADFGEIAVDSGPCAATGLSPTGSSTGMSSRRVLSTSTVPGVGDRGRRSDAVATGVPVDGTGQTAPRGVGRRSLMIDSGVPPNSLASSATPHVPFYPRFVLSRVDVGVEQMATGGATVADGSPRQTLVKVPEENGTPEAVAERQGDHNKGIGFGGCSTSILHSNLGCEVQEHNEEGRESSATDVTQGEQHPADADITTTRNSVLALTTALQSARRGHPRSSIACDMKAQVTATEAVGRILDEDREDLLFSDAQSDDTVQGTEREGTESPKPYSCVAVEENTHPCSGRTRESTIVDSPRKATIRKRRLRGVASKAVSPTPPQHKNPPDAQKDAGRLKTQPSFQPFRAKQEKEDPRDAGPSRRVRTTDSRKTGAVVSASNPPEAIKQALENRQAFEAALYHDRSESRRVQCRTGSQRQGSRVAAPETPSKVRERYSEASTAHSKKQVQTTTRTNGSQSSRRSKGKS